MSFFGIGPMELIFILIIMILVLGPKNMVESAKKFGVTLRKIVKSPLWATVMDTSREIREIPTRLIREAGIEEDLKNIKSTTDTLKNVGNISVPVNPISVDLSQKNGEGKDKNILPEQPAGVQPDNNIASTSDTDLANNAQENKDEPTEQNQENNPDIKKEDLSENSDT